jgi:hypothetical protein
MKKRRALLTNSALHALITSCSAHLAGEEGEGDLADVRFADLERAKLWANEELEAREQRRRRVRPRIEG